MTFSTRRPIATEQVTGLILAGGQGSRMGGVDKGLELLRGRALVEHAIERLQPQVGALAISANRNVADYARYGYPVFRDLGTAPEGSQPDGSRPDSSRPDISQPHGSLSDGSDGSQPDDLRFGGPLAGIAAGLASIRTDWLLVVPCDAPLLPTDLASRLIEAIEVSAADIALAVTVEPDGMRQRHPVFALIPRRLAASAAAALVAQERKLDAWYRHHSPVEVSFRDSRAFYNANTLNDLRELER